jgi:hypothetical protein
MGSELDLLAPASAGLFTPEGLPTLKTKCPGVRSAQLWPSVGIGIA